MVGRADTYDHPKEYRGGEMAPTTRRLSIRKREMWQRSRPEWMDDPRKGVCTCWGRMRYITADSLGSKASMLTGSQSTLLKMQFKPLALALSWAIPTAAANIAAKDTSPSAIVSQGTVLGTTTVYADSTAVATKYIGIPFAKSPPLRFGPPEAAPTFVEPYAATETKPACLQQFSCAFS
jgi:hypothetical protein